MCLDLDYSFFIIKYFTPLNKLLYLTSFIDHNSPVGWFDVYEKKYIDYLPYNLYIFLFVFGISTVFFAYCCILSRNPIFSVLFLILLFLSLGSMFLVLRLYFVGLLIIFIYVGAISILFLFVLMIVDFRILFSDKEYIHSGKFFNLLLIMNFVIIILFIITNFFINFGIVYLNPTKLTTFSSLMAIIRNYIELFYINARQADFFIDNILHSSGAADSMVETFILAYDDIFPKKFNNKDFFSLFYSENDVFGLAQYLFNYFTFHIFLVFCILLVCMFGAIAVVINKTNIRPSRGSDNFFQVKTADFTII